MTLRWRIASVVAVFVLLLFADAAMGIQVARQREQISTRLDTTIEPARQATDELLNALVNQEVGLRGYVLTRDRAFLRTYTSGRADSRQAVDELTSLLADEPGLRPDVEAVETSLTNWQEQTAALQLEAVRDGRTNAGELVDSAGGVALFDAARRDIAQLDAQLRDQHAEALTGLHTAQQRLLATVVAAAAIAVFLAVGVAWLLHRWISQPVEGLSESVERVAGGVLTAEIPRTGPGELADLGANVDHMRHRLVAQLDEATRARQALEQHGPAVVSLRSALTPEPSPLPPWVVGAAAFAPARGVLAGDWYDVFVLDDDRVVVAVMDVSGHGPAAGVLALRAKEQLHAALRGGQAPGEALCSVATRLGDTGEEFLTCFVAEVSRQGVCRYASAGHPPAKLLSSSGTHPLEPTGPLLGPLAGSWHSCTFDLSPDTSLLVFTDGLLEARDEDGHAFDLDHLDELLEAHRQAAPAELVSGLAAALAAFTGGSFGDDVTLVAISCQEGPAQDGSSYLRTFPVADGGAVDTDEARPSVGLGA